MRRVLRATFVSLLACLSWSLLASAQKSSRLPFFRHADGLAKYVQAHHKAPFDRDSIQLGQRGAAELMKHQALRSSAFDLVPGSGNVKINRDRDPWPKAEVASAVDPITGNVVVMTNDFRENWDHMFYHVSTNAGHSWTDDSMVGGADIFTAIAPQLTFESDPGVAFDDKGHSFLSTITGNEILDLTNGYENFDTQVIVAQGYNNGTYSNLLPILIDTQPCNGTASGGVLCPAQLDKPLITVDSVPGSPNNGTIYVYYTVFCLGPGSCTYGASSIPAGGSSIVESHSPGFGFAYSAPQIVSGAFTQEQFSDIVVDSHGVPHAFFDDFSTGININMYMSTLGAGGWTVNPTPVATFIPVGLATPNWFFRINGTFAPGCGISGDTAYCAFSSNQVGTGPFEAGMSVYLATVDTQSGASSISRVNNDIFNNGKDHIFPWATTKADGSVYVGFYDDRDDPFLTKANYWVAKSTDGGMTFPKQQPVNAVQFNPCIGFPFCGFFGDYTQIAAGRDGIVHAQWSDTRDGASMQIFGQAITW
jgi:hypothetical protein